MQKLPHADIPRPHSARLDELVRHPLVLVLEDIRSAHNVGSILRTADALLVQEVVLCGITPPATHKAAFKASLGAEEFVPWRQESSAAEVLNQLAAEGYTCAALELTDQPSLADTLEPSHYPLALVVGNEVEGVSDAALEQFLMALEIPQFGAKQSFNVAVATALAAHEVIKRHRSLTDKPVFWEADPRFASQTPEEPTRPA
ncbi:MAG: TrmH family RNA methyltransferase [Bacteroidota bacterium]|nr:TrmH family RNA methyltransferase [Bacteroidota bacterium]